MKNSFFLNTIFCLAAAQTTAQNNIEYTQTDLDYANTTVVFKTGNADDLAVLDQLNDDFGMSDVIRIRTAPTKTIEPTVSPKPKILAKNLPARPVGNMVSKIAVAPKKVAATKPSPVAPEVLKEAKIVSVSARTKIVSVKKTTKSPRKTGKLRAFSAKKYRQKGKQQYICYKF